MASLLATAAVFIGAHGFRPLQEPTALKAGSIRARKFVVENTEGKMVARLESTVKGTALELFATDGKVRLLLACAPSGDTIVKLQDAKEKARSILTMAPDGNAGLFVISDKGTFAINAAGDTPPVLRMHGKSAKDLVLLGARQVKKWENTCLELKGRAGNGIGVMAKGDGSGAFVMQDAQKVPRAALIVPKKPGECGITIFGTSGEAALGMYGRGEREVWLRMRDRTGRERAALGIDADDQTHFFVKDENDKVVAGDSK